MKPQAGEDRRGKAIDGYKENRGKEQKQKVHPEHIDMLVRSQGHEQTNSPKNIEITKGSRREAERGVVINHHRMREV